MQKLKNLKLQSLSETQSEEIKGGRWKVTAIHVGVGVMGQECSSRVYMENNHLFGPTEYAVNQD